MGVEKTFPGGNTGMCCFGQGAAAQGEKRKRKKRRGEWWEFMLEGSAGAKLR